MTRNGLTLVSSAIEVHDLQESLMWKDTWLIIVPNGGPFIVRPVRKEWQEQFHKVCIIQTSRQCRDLRYIKDISIQSKQSLCLHSWECMVDSGG